MEDHPEQQAVGRAPETPITEFKQEYRFLSNFWPCRVLYGPHWYPSVEHAYQAAKCAHAQDQLAIRQAASAGMAKRMGKEVELRTDWTQIKLEVMADLLWQKFILNPKLRDQLLATGERELIEGNGWGDTFWGKCRGEGSNHLGNLIMRLRDLARYVDSYSDGHSTREPAG